MTESSWQRRRQLWIVTKHDDARVGVLHVDPSGARETLPVFSHEGEAEAFLGLMAPGRGWRAKKIAPGELVSMLRGPCARVQKVVLNPPPATDSAMFDLLSLSREDFMRELTCNLTTREITMPDYVMRDFGPRNNGTRDLAES